MRLFFVILIAIIISSSANAQKLFAPVQIVHDAEVCGSFDMLKYRENLRAEQRTEALEGLQGLDAFSPEGGANKCFLAAAGKYMFFDHSNAQYACMRPRAGADCYWMRADALGDIYELFPGRKLAQGNKGVTCDAWARAAQQAADNIERERKTIFAGTPQNLGDQFVQGMVKDTLNMFTGSATASQQTRGQLCRFSLRSLQENARRLTAYNACPAIDTSGMKAKLQTSYDADMRFFRECL